MEMPFELTAHSFGPPQHWNILFLQRFDIWEQPQVILDAGLEDEKDTHAAEEPLLKSGGWCFRRAGVLILECVEVLSVCVFS